MTNKKNKNPGSQSKQANDKINADRNQVTYENRNVLKNDFYYFLGLGIVLLLIFIIRKNFLTIPFERDEGSYVYSGKTILDGAITYRDIGSQRLDGVFYAYAAIVGIFGYTISSLHFAFMLMNIASTVLMFFLARKLFNNLAALASSAFFALLSMTAMACGFTIQSEHIVAFFIIGAFLSLIHFFDSKKTWQLIAAGILFSFAFQVKQTSFFYGLFAGILVIYKCYNDNRKNIRNIILNTFLFCLSIIIPLLIDFLIIYKNGAWPDFILWFFNIRNQYTSLITFDEGLQALNYSFSDIFHHYEFFWIASFISMIIVFFTKLLRWKKIMIAGLPIAGFLTVVPGYHFYGHYFLQWIPAVSLSAAFFVYAAKEFISKKLKLKYTTSLVFILLILLPILINLSILNKYYFSPDNTKVLKEVYGPNPFQESKVIADKLNSIMKPEDKLAVFGTEIEVYVYTNKKSPSRFAGSGALLEFVVPESKDWQREFIRDVENAAPKYMVFFSHDISWMINPKAENLIFPWFLNFSFSNYKIIGFADIYDDTTVYVWEPEVDMVNNPPKSMYKIFVYERK